MNKNSVRSFILRLALLTCASSTVSAASQTGVIHTLHPHLQNNLVHIYLEGEPVFDQDGCPQYWTANSMDDEKFRTYIWPVLMTAHAQQAPIKINVSGCIGIYPKIISVDYQPRD